VTDQTRLVDGLVRLLKAEPTLLDRAPDGDPVALINHRTKDEVHTCLRCPSQARTALLADCGMHGQRFVDLCPPCFIWLRNGLTDLQAEVDRRAWTACWQCGRWMNECHCNQETT
jgi:hypothetical protein